jgi:threonine aldolase
MPQAPQRLFASDNASGIHPEYLEAITTANSSHQLAYGSDSHTARATSLFQSLADADVEVLFTFGGTGANVLALGALLQRAESVVCSEWAHIAVDETGAPERLLGVKLQTLPAPHGKITPTQVVALLHTLGNVHHVQPGVVSISQPTEMGTLYSLSEIRELCSTAHSHGLRVHLDGARIGNAVAALGGDVTTFRNMTFAAGVDAVSFGGTKNGMWNAEAVLLRRDSNFSRARFLRKQFTQLPSKMRFASAQFARALDGNLWIETARHSNVMAERLFAATRRHGVLQLVKPEVNSLFPTLPEPAKTALQEWSFFWDWDVSRSQVRWMTSWDTTEIDIAQFAAGVDAVLEGID